MDRTALQRARSGTRWALSVAILAVGTGVVLGCGTAARRPASPEVTDAGVTFRYHDPVAQVVQVSGSWASNFYLRGRDWTSDTRVGRMQRDADGTWELRVPLSPGRYEYVFLVDGRFWHLDPSNPQRQSDGAGGWVSLLVVP